MEAVGALVEYFDTNYVNGTVRTIRRPTTSNRIEPICIRRIQPLFPPALWNVDSATIQGDPRTKNFCESWNNGFSQLVGHSHPSLWVLIGALQQDEAMVSTAILQDARGQPPTKRVKHSVKQLQARLLQLCRDRQYGTKSLEDTLRGLGHTIRF